MRHPTQAQLERVRYVRTLLEWHGLNHQTRLAEILGCAQQTASNKLNGKRRFTAEDLIAIAEATGVDPGHLLKPPELAEILGPVRSSDPDLLRCTLHQGPQVRGYVSRRPVGKNTLTPCGLGTAA